MNRGSTSLGRRHPVFGRTTTDAASFKARALRGGAAPASALGGLPPNFKLRQHLAALPCDNFDLARFSFFHLLSRNAEE